MLNQFAVGRHGRHGTPQGADLEPCLYHTMTMGSRYRIDNRKGVHLAHHRHLLTSVISLTALAAQYTTVLMAQEKEKAFWTEPEVTALVNYLYEHRSERAEGGNFKMSTFNGAAPKRLQGPQKTGKMCQKKWTSVRCIMLLIIDIS